MELNVLNGRIFMNEFVFTVFSFQLHMLLIAAELVDIRLKVLVEL